jgi:hypothetical protein
MAKTTERATNFLFSTLAELESFLLLMYFQRNQLLIIVKIKVQ